MTLCSLVYACSEADVPWPVNCPQTLTACAFVPSPGWCPASIIFFLLPSAIRSILVLETRSPVTALPHTSSRTAHLVFLSVFRREIVDLGILPLISSYCGSHSGARGISRLCADVLACFLFHASRKYVGWPVSVAPCA